MKTIRNEKIIFDELTEEEFEAMSEQIIEQNDIDYRTIQTNAFEELGLKQRSRRSHKKIVVTLVAAAVLLSTIGIGAAATISFRNAFGDIFVGDSPDGVATGSSLRIDSKKVDVEFLGVCGNDHYAYSSMNLTRKDGSAFVSEDYIKDLQHVFVGYDGCVYETYPDYMPDQDKTPGLHGEPTENWCVHCSRNVDISFADAVDYNTIGMGSIDYYFESASTLRAYTSYFHQDNIRNTKMFVRERGCLNGYHSLEVVYQDAKDSDDRKEICSDVVAGVKARFPKEWKVFAAGANGVKGDSDEDWEAFCLIYREIKKAYQPLLKDNQLVMLDPTRCVAVSIVEKTPLDVEYNLSVNLDYQTTTRELAEDPSKEFSVTDPSGKEYRFSFDSFTADPFGMMTTVRRHSDFKLYEFLDAFHPEETTEDPDEIPSFWDYSNVPFEVELTNGEKYVLVVMGSTESVDEETQTYRWIYADRDSSRIATIDPAQIKSVRFGDIAVFG